MKICLVQIASLRGKIQENINKHVRYIEQAVQLNVDLIIFPELSITAYEPELANELATTANDDMFNPFQNLADKHDIAIGVGMPTKALDGINISMLIFQAFSKRLVYSKQMLHDDELPYFVRGKEQLYLRLKGKKIALGICYESLQLEHFLTAKENEADIYIASVAKPKGGLEKAYLHFPKIAKEFNTPILMSNSVGFCDNFLSLGQSAVWNKKGELLKQLDDQNEGLLIYDTELDQAKGLQFEIEQGKLADLEALFQIYLNAKEDLELHGIFQWTETYPTKSIIENDIRKGLLYTLSFNKEIIGAINISEEQEKEYELIDWQFDKSKVLVIHRLVINPKFQGQGNAQKLMNYAETFARENNYSSIRLDAYSPNKRVLDFYKKRAYFIRGQVHFPGRPHPFYCMEKEIQMFH